MIYTLTFYAWIGQIDEIDFEDPTEYFTVDFNSVEEAKNYLSYSSFIWRG